MTAIDDDEPDDEPVFIGKCEDCCQDVYDDNGEGGFGLPSGGVLCDTCAWYRMVAAGRREP